jgi:hypothetical protein
MFFLSVLDPRISYTGMKADYANDNDLANYLKKSKESLHKQYLKDYAPANSSTPLPPPCETSSVRRAPSSPQKVDFTSRFRRKENRAVDELEEYFKLPQEDFETCNPIQWWFGRRTQFPNLFRLARDILSIPGKFSMFVYRRRRCSSYFSQGPLLLLRGYFPVDGTPYLFGEQASSLTPSVH